MTERKFIKLTKAIVKIMRTPRNFNIKKFQCYTLILSYYIMYTIEKHCVFVVLKTIFVKIFVLNF